MKSKRINGGTKRKKKKNKKKEVWNEEKVEELKENEIGFRIVKGKVARRRNDVEERTFRKKKR